MSLQNLNPKAQERSKAWRLPRRHLPRQSHAIRLRSFNPWPCSQRWNGWKFAQYIGKRQVHSK